MSLNEEQQIAVKHRGSGLLVLAGAGTGKTRVITHRIVDLVKSGVDPKRILAVTFTNKAAKEMRERLDKMGIQEGAWIGTFHSIGLRILRMHGDQIGYLSNFTIYDDDAQKSLVKALLADVNTRGLKIVPGVVHFYISDLKGKNIGWRDIKESSVPKALQPVVQEVYQRYERSLLRSNAMDFADLLVNTVKLLQCPEDSPQGWLLRRFSYVLVDEFQDTNAIQMNMVDLLAKHGEICVVGDDDQCQPKGTLVATPTGEKPIEELQAGDLVVSWNRNTQEIRSRGRAITRVSSRFLKNESLFKIVVDEKATCTTKNHKFIVRWAPHKNNPAYITYLMYRKDLGYRVGWCRLHNAHGGFNFGNRMRLEMADSGWVLSAFNNQAEASVYTAMMAAKHGIPTTTFELPTGSRQPPLYTEEGIRKIFEAASPQGGLRCLEEHNLFPEYPFWPPPNDAPGARRTLFECYAANLIPNLMLIPSATVKRGWIAIHKIETVQGVSTEVYSLDVEKDKTYVADGIVTHNSIYGWRGADPKGMQSFVRRPGTKLVKLVENYRCTDNILACANAVIANNSGRIGKSLKPNKKGVPVRVSQVMDERAEARHVAQTIQKRPVFGDYAVLYRTHAQSRALEEAFRHAGIPYTIIGGLRFYDRAEIKDMLAYFRLAVNPKSDVDLLRVANKPTRGMGDKRMGQLKMQASKLGQTMFETLKDSSDQAHQNLYGIVESLCNAKQSSIGLLDFYDSVLKITGYKDALVKTLNSSKSKAQQETAQAKLENVNELAADCSTYTEEHVGSTVDEYLEHVALVSSADKESGPSVSLMTIHAAKGLEFPHVFIVGFEERLLPHANSINESETMRVSGSYVKEDDPIEEERRLCYVAITRAKEELDITIANQRQFGAKWERATPSRFLNELPEAHIKRSGI